MIITAIVEGKPVGKGRHRTAIVGGRVHTYTPDATVEYENRVRAAWLKAGGKPLDGALEVCIMIYCETPKSYSIKRRSECLAGIERPTKKPDIDNVCKAVLDALNGYAYKDDKQVICLRAAKEYDLEPRTVITVRDLECLKED